MDRDEFIKRWRKSTNLGDKEKLLSEEFNTEFGSFKDYRNALPTIKASAPIFMEEYAQMKINNLNAKETQKTSKVNSGSRNEKLKVVDKIVQEMTNIPDLIQKINPVMTSQVNKTVENGNSRSDKSVLDHKNNLNHKPSNESNNKSHKSDQKRPHSQSNKHKLDNTFTDNEQYKHRKLETPTRATISEIPSTSKPRESDSKTELFVCRFPEYAVGEYVGYRIKKTGEKSPDLPDSVVSINVSKMPSVKRIMQQVKERIKLVTQQKSISSDSNLNCALYLSGLMLYAVFEFKNGDVNILIREILAILSTIRSTFLTRRESKNYEIVSSMLYLVEGHLCERFYENTLESTCKRRQLMQECKASFSQFGVNEELIHNNFNAFIGNKDQKEILEDLCSKDKITIPKLYYQLLMENSQHSMLHERYVYTKRLAIQKMKTSEQALWKRLTIDMKLRLESNSGIDIADAIFTIFYWIYHRQT